MATVDLEHVHKTYEGGFEAVRDFNLAIKEREFIVLVGPSGCGKSTTLRMIAGLEEITSGKISIGGKVMNKVAPKDRDIAMVFQSYALYPHMTVFENMAFALKLRKLPKAAIADKVRRAADVLGIGSELGKRPKQLSGGQRQRVALGRAIVREPRCFLFDEPLSNLDAKLRVEMRAEIKRLHLALGSTTVYVTHDQEEAITLGDRVVVMKDGDRPAVRERARHLPPPREPVRRRLPGHAADEFSGGAPGGRRRAALVRRGDGPAPRAGAGDGGAARARGGGGAGDRARPAARGAGAARGGALRAGRLGAGDEGLAGAAAGRQDGRFPADRAPRPHRRPHRRVGRRGRARRRRHPPDRGRHGTRALLRSRRGRDRV